jgi:oxygen-dependent protoporphyrinogen oxidase
MDEASVKSKSRELNFDLRNRKVAVVGAGAVGLACALHLKKRGASVELVERRNAVGGMIRSALHGDRYILDSGPSFFFAGHEEIARIARELSIDKLIVGDPKRRPCCAVFSGGKLRRLPGGNFSLASTPLIPPSARVSLIVKSPAKVHSAAGLTLAEFVRRRAGADALRTVMGPLVAWMSGGNPEELEAEAVFSWVVDGWRVPRALKPKNSSGDISAIRPGAQSFKWGMGTLTARLEEVLRGAIRTGSTCISIDAREGGGYILSLREDRRLIGADCVIIATPAHEAARVLMKLDDCFEPPLMGIPYTPMVKVDMAFPSEHVRLDGACSIVLVPRGEGIRAFGCVLTSRLFMGRCPAGQTLVTAVYGGSDDEDVADLSDAELTVLALEEMRQIVGCADVPVFTNISRVHSAMPQYIVGHMRRLADIDATTRKYPGLFLTGNYFSGSTLHRSIAHARVIADNAISYLRTL